MLRIRTTKTSSSATAIQVVRYDNRRTVIVKHIGSANTFKEISLLKQAAIDWIQQETGQRYLLPPENKSSKISKIIDINKCHYLGVNHTFIYEIINQIFKLFKFDQINNPLLLDLVLIRIIEPTSKLQSLKLLKQYFDVYHSRNKMYRQMPTFDSLKNNIEEKIVNFAKKNLHFNFSLVFYDVTTLYFESFKDDELRKCGFSKDNKFNQPQILIGLTVNQDGFPVSFEIFKGNKFEGHTLLPAILNIKNKYKIKNLTVVADAAMISRKNVDLLLNQGLDYIVGARLGNLKLSCIKDISRQLNKVDKNTIRLKTDHGWLVCSFLRKRYNKNKYDMEKQIKKAEIILKQPASILKRCKFVKTSNNKHSLNQQLIEKSELLLGLRGYYTNLSDISNEKVIEHYHNLWNVEKSFRIAKTDLKIRPIYHWKDKAIKAHILICFMALAVCKFVEVKTGISTQKFVQSFKSVSDAKLFNTINNQEIILRSEVSQELYHLLDLLNLSY